MGTTINEYPEGTEKNPKDSKCCKNCRHYCPYIYEYDCDEPNDSVASDYGECRRYPPASLHTEEARFPVVTETAWCGEFDF